MKIAAKRHYSRAATEAGFVRFEFERLYVLHQFLTLNNEATMLSSTIKL